MLQTKFNTKGINKNILSLIFILNPLSYVFGSLVLQSENKIRIDVKWSPADVFNKDLVDGETLLMTTVDKEQYKCVLPSTQSADQQREKAKLYDGPTPMELLSPLFSQLLCYFRIESYWSYELCHGYYLRQFHDETNALGRVLQEFYLGKFDLSNWKKKEHMHSKQNSTNIIGKLPKVRVEDAYLPYWSLNMTDGTYCDLKGQNRFVNVLYVCHPRGNNAMYSFRETSSCEYEIIVLTTVLCKHPAFRIDHFEESSIECYPLPGNPPRPKRLYLIEKSLAEEYESLKPSEPVDAPKKEEKTVPFEPIVVPKTSVYTVDQKLMDDILSGQYCLRGGSSWWRYEFCYGKHVEQYHDNADGSRNTIVLGRWNMKRHLEWLDKFPYKKQKSEELVKHVSHFYSEGNLCEELSKPREVEVKLRCKELADQPNYVSLYLIEPKTCVYILVVESPIFCSLLEHIDDDGLTQNLRHV